MEARPCRLLPTAYYLLPTTYHLPLTTYYCSGVPVPLSAPRRIGTPLETPPPVPPPPAPPPPLEARGGGAGGGDNGVSFDVPLQGDVDGPRLQGGQGDQGGVAGGVATHGGEDVPKLRAELDLLREMCAQCAAQQRGLEEQTRREATLLCASFNHARRVVGSRL